ncbi:hypothetical protein EU64_14970, partial [Staphylococcus aureus]
MKERLRKVIGGFFFAILTNDALYGVIVSNAFRPNFVCILKNGTYTLTSETCAIDVLGVEFVQEIHVGEN